MVFSRVLTLTAFVLASTGCKPEEGTTASGTDSTAAGSTGQTTGTNPTSGATGSSSDGTAAASSTAPTTGLNCLNAPNGSACADPCDCESGACSILGPLGGVCSECDEDADCKSITGFGCNPANPLDGTPGACSKDGSPGQHCESAEACAQGLVCGLLADVPGIVSIKTCGLCDQNGGCSGGLKCAPHYDPGYLGGVHQCVGPGSLPDGEGCDLTGDGSECQSGKCAPTTLMGTPIIGICSPCAADADCTAPAVCKLPELVIEADSIVLAPGSCA